MIGLTESGMTSLPLLPLVKVGAALPPPRGRPVRLFLKILLKARTDDGQVNTGKEPQAALRGADSRENCTRKPRFTWTLAVSSTQEIRNSRVR